MAIGHDPKETGRYPETETAWRHEKETGRHSEKEQAVPSSCSVSMTVTGTGPLESKSSSHAWRE